MNSSFVTSGPGLGPNCLQRLSADNTSRQIVNKTNSVSNKICVCFSVLCAAVNVSNSKLFYNSTPVPDGSYLYPTTLTIHCDKGFLLEGSSEIYCQEDGNWSHTDNRCTGKTTDTL